MRPSKGCGGLVMNRPEGRGPLGEKARSARTSLEPFEHFHHGADIGIRGIGATPSEAFVGAAKAVFSLLSEDLEKVRPLRQEAFVCEATGLEELLVAYLNELISLADTRGLVFGRFAVEITRDSGTARLHAKAWGEAFDASRHESTVLPKGATFTALRVAEQNGHWIAQCVVDV
jgi:protein archease